MPANDRALFQTDFTIATADFTAGATTQTYPIALPQAGVMIWGAVVRQVAALGGGGVATAVIRVGTRGDVDALCDDVNVFTGQANGLKQDLTNVTLPILSTTVDIIAQVQVDTTVGALTAGSAVIKVFWSPIQ